MTPPAPSPGSRPFPPENPRTCASRVARDIPRPPAAPGAPSGARARRPGAPRALPGAAPERASDHGARGTLRCTPAASSSRTARARTSSGTRCIDGTSAERVAPPDPTSAPRWLNIAPPPDPRSPGALDQYPAPRWLRPRAPLKHATSSRFERPTTSPSQRSASRSCARSKPRDCASAPPCHARVHSRDFEREETCCLPPSSQPRFETPSPRRHRTKSSAISEKQ